MILKREKQSLKVSRLFDWCEKMKEIYEQKSQILLIQRKEIQILTEKA